VAWALGHAHGRGVIHRDIKPDNILLESGTCRAIVTDLGIAHAEGSAVSGAAGTPHYVAPELLEGGAPSAASDLYALGVTAWVALAGRRPFEGMEGAALMALLAHAPAPSIGSILPRLSPRLVSAIDRCLEREPSARWPDAEAFAAELGATQALRHVIPAPLRRFVVEGRSLGEQAVFGFIGAVASEVGLIALFGWDDFAGVVFHALAALLGAFALIRFGEIVAQARELRAQGWGQSAAVAADRAESVEDDPQLSFAAAPMRRRWFVAGSGVVKTALAVVALKLSFDSLVLGLLAASAMVIIPALTAVQLWRIRTAGKPTLWSRLLQGRAGRFIFRVAGIGLPRRGASPVPGEPTALALAGSIEALYAALPAAQQRRLAEVPDLAARLQARAFAQGPDRTPAVAALETLRLDILRLQAGTIDEPELTADLEGVRKLGEEIDRVVAASEEVRGILG
jgi:serine/threonine-protein kinase